MRSRRRVEWTAAHREALEALIRHANGKRTSRLLTITEVERCAEAALKSELGFAWVNAGDAPDARSLTSVCLCAISGEQLTIGVAAGHAAATPASAWPDISSWDRYREPANASACRAWAGRSKADRISIPLAEPATTANASREEMLAAILANPEEDGPRLVFADWLSERGDPRGSFIAIQCELAGGSARGQDLAAEEEALLSAHGGQWLKGLPDDVVHVHFRRGFAESAEVRDASALGELEGFFQSEPVTELSFVSPQALDAERFATLQWLERLRSLEFRAPRPNAPGALSLARLTHVLDSRRLGRLVRLVLVGQRLGDDGLALLAAQGGKALTGLEGLIVEDDAVTDRGVAPFAASKWGARLTELSLANNELNVDGAAALAESRSPGRLTRLSLGGNQLGNAGASVLAGSRRFGSLSSLSLPRNRIGAAGLDALLDSKTLGGLSVLDLTGNPLGAAGRKRLRARFGDE